MFTASCVMPMETKPSTLAFVVNEDDEMLVYSDKTVDCFPTLSDLEPKMHGLTVMHYLGTFNGVDCILYKCSNFFIAGDNLEFKDLRTLLRSIDPEHWFLAGYAKQIFDWDRDHHFCGRCATETVYISGERSRKCDECGLINYPRISPAMIVLVKKGNQILLAKNKMSRFGFYSLLAGFFEPGESLEDCVRREVREEVGLEVKNIQYFQSQAWPLPNSLMFGCFADYDSGDIKIDEKELSDAQWFDIDNMPEIPPSISISRKLIDEFLKNN